MLFAKLKSTNIQARKTKDKIVSEATGFLISEVNRIMIDAGIRNEDPTDEIVSKCAEKVINGINETLKFKTSGTEEFDTLTTECAIYKEFVTEKFTEEVLRSKIAEAMSTGANDMKTVMGYMKENYAGLYDGKMASSLIMNALKKN